MASLLASLSGALAETVPVYKNSQAPLEQRVEDLFARLTPKEKLSLMAGGSFFSMQQIERLGIPALRLSDGPNGVRSNEGEAMTVFPTGSALAATWNPALLESIGQAIGREALASNVQVMLGPNVNIQRSPLGGRNFEAYSEDPYLAGRIGAGFVKGVQSLGVGTSVKHFVANEQEAERTRGDSIVDERTLREIYLLPFEIIVKEAHPWTVMASYNRVNGTYMTENEYLIRNILKGEWGFDGLLMSDWGAVHTTVEAANGGLDLEMPGPGRYFGPALAQATRNWQVEQPVIDEAVRRALRLIIRTGALDGKDPTGAQRDRNAVEGIPRSTNGATWERESREAPAARRGTTGESRSERNRGAALAAAREAITLLKNDRGLLPLDRSKLRSVAIIGPNADVPLYQGGGSAAVIPSGILTPLMSLQAALGSSVKVLYAQGADNDPLPPPADARLLSPAEDRKEQGLRVSYYNNASFEGTPTQTVTETFFDRIAFAAGAGAQGKVSVRWEGFMWPPRTGTYEFGLGQVGTATLYVDDRRVVDADLGTLHPPQLDFGPPVRTATLELTAGRAHRIRIDYVSLPIPFRSMHLGIRLPAGSIDEAVQAARSADAAVLFVGSSRSSETEGRDRADMELAGRQNELVQAVLAANANTVVVLNNGAPLSLPWAERAPTLVEAWLPGEEGARALAQILLGDANPSGKLPFTFPQRLEDNPAYLNYSAGREAAYGEGVFVGYRYYEKRKLQPLFPFGHGLSYTRFEYSNLRAAASTPAGQPFQISVDIRNAGVRPGQETVQVYVGDEATTQLVRPVKELKAFQKVSLAPGESKTLKFTLTARDLSYYDIHRHDWASTPGTHRIYIGSSSADVRLQQELHWTASPADPRAPAAEQPSLLDFF
ncbi:MAG: glycoside hydrolase family 3 C-terminal domain-containing protein [Steroidobacteraceae bacterium]